MAAADFRQLWLALQAHHLEVEAQNAYLRQSLEQLEQERDEQVDFYNTAPVACLATDGNGIITSSNPQLATLAECLPEKLRDRPMAELFQAEDQDAYHLHRMSALAVDQCVVSDLRLRRRPDPVWVSVESRGVGSGGQARKIWWVLRDITARKKAELERARVVERAQQIEKLDAIGTLAGGIARELKDILTDIMLGPTVRPSPAGDAGPELSPDLVAAVARGSRLTQQLLDVARRRLPHAETFRPAAVAERAFEALKRTAPERIRVRLMVDEEAGWIEGDSDRCLQMLMHLCTNAIEAIPGQGVVTLAVREISPGDARLAEMPELPALPHVAIDVVDDGVGMDATTLRHACEPYFTTKGRSKAYGLGLSAVYGTVRAWGGGIAITSVPGQGTRVSMLFPARPARHPRRCPSLPDRGLGDLVTLLVVDDDAVVRDGLAQRLEALGHRVLTAATSEAAAALYRQNLGRIGAVVVDFSTPAIDGIACFTKLRQIDSEARVVLFMRRGAEQEAAAAQALLVAGHCHIVCKPCTPDELSNALTQALTGSGA